MIRARSRGPGLLAAIMYSFLNARLVSPIGVKAQRVGDPICQSDGGYGSQRAPPMQLRTGEGSRKHEPRGWTELASFIISGLSGFSQEHRGSNLDILSKSLCYSTIHQNS